MEIREPHSLAKLFLESFSVTNRAFGRIVVYLFLSVVGIILQQLLMLVGFPPLFILILNAVYSAFLSVLLFKILAAQAEMETVALADLMFASALPAVYMCLLGVMYSIVVGGISLIAGLVGALLPKLFLLGMLAVGLLVALFLLVRLCFAPFAIALREQGPVQAITYSWNLTNGHFFYVLFAILFSTVFPLLCLAGAVYGLYVGIPLYFADSFNILHLSAGWWIAFALLLVLFGFIWLSMVSFVMLVFLNLDYTEGEAAASQVLQTPQTHENGTVLSAGAAVVSKNASTPNVQVLKASVKTYASDDSLDQHLNEIYQPLPQENIRQTEEDRMPTLVFDEEMAAQMAKEREMWEQEKAKAQQTKQNPGEDGRDFIKMSK